MTPSAAFNGPGTAHASHRLLSLRRVSEIAAVSTNAPPAISTRSRCSPATWHPKGQPPRGVGPATSRAPGARLFPPRLRWRQRSFDRCSWRFSTARLKPRRELHARRVGEKQDEPRDQVTGNHRHKRKSCRRPLCVCAASCGQDVRVLGFRRTRHQRPRPD